MTQLLFNPGTYFIQVLSTVVIPAYLMKSGTTEQSHSPAGRPIEVTVNCVLEKVEYMETECRLCRKLSVQKNVLFQSRIVFISLR